MNTLLLSKLVSLHRSLKKQEHSKKTVVRVLFQKAVEVSTGMEVAELNSKNKWSCLFDGH